MKILQCQVKMVLNPLLGDLRPGLVGFTPPPNYTIQLAWVFSPLLS